MLCSRSSQTSATRGDHIDKFLEDDVAVAVGVEHGECLEVVGDTAWARNSLVVLLEPLGVEDCLHQRMVGPIEA